MDSKLEGESWVHTRLDREDRHCALGQEGLGNELHLS
jgi:hypothetical protein